MFNHLKSGQQKSDFSKLFLESIDEALNQILGENLTNIVYYYFQRYFSLKKKDFPTKVEEFAEALEKSFGTGAPIIKKIVVKNLYAKLEIDFTEKEDFDFIGCIDFAKRKMEERKI